MSHVPQTHAPANSTSNSKPPSPPPTDDQMYQVRDLASQLHYGFKKRPRVGADGRGSWEARFMRKFHAMLKILVVARFDELPPFAIGCVWENNRRLHAKEPRFDPERVISAKSSGHPAYLRDTEGRLRYKPAFAGSIMALKRERDIRDNWWRKSAPLGHHENAPAPEAFEGMVEEQVVGEVGADVAGEPSHSVNKNGGTEGGAIDEGESEVEREPDAADTIPSRGTRGRRGRGSKATAPPSAAQVSGVTAEGKKSEARRRRRPIGDEEIGMEIDGERSDQGRGSGKARSSQGTSAGAEARTRSASRRRAAAGQSEATTQSGPSPGTVKPKSSKSKGKQRSSAKLTLYDLQPERILSAFIEYPRPCDRCRKLNISCIFNPLSRSYCDPCRNKKAQCSNAFKIITDHCMATYLGYASFRMASDPSTYVDPTFSPTHLPNPLPTNIEWFRTLYDEAKKGGKSKAKKAIAASPMIAPNPDEAAASELPAQPIAGELPRESSHQSGRSTPRTSRSRSVSQAHSVASSTMPGPSTASVQEPPPSPSAMSEMSHGLPPEAAGTSFSNSSHHYALRTPDAMSVDGEEGVGTSTAASNVVSSERGEGVNAPRRITLRSGTNNESEQMPALTVRGSEFQRDSTSRQQLSAFPPPPPRGATRPTTSVQVVPRLRESWKLLPGLGPRMPDGYYSVVAAPHNEDWIARWQELANTGGTNTSVPWDAHAHLNSHTEPTDRPQTPQSRLFTVSDEVQRVVHTTRARFDEIALIKERMQAGAALNNHQSRDIFRRRPSNAQQPVPGDNDGSLIRLEDLSSIFVALGEVYSALSRFSEVFECIPAVPVNWTALRDLLTQIEQLRDLYKVSWEHFASLEEDVRPLRAEMQRVRYGVAHVQDRLDGISNDAVSACEPLIHNLYRQIDTRLSRLEQGSGPSPSPLAPQLGDVLKVLTRLSERVEQLERAADADDSRTRIDGYISRYLADRGLHDHILRQLGTGAKDILSSGSAGSSISHVLHTVHPPALTATASFATSVTASASSSNIPSATLPSTHAMPENPGGFAPFEPPQGVVDTAPGTSAPSTASPSAGGRIPSPGPGDQIEQPAHHGTEETGIRHAVSTPQKASVVSRMYGKSRGGRRGS